MWIFLYKKVVKTTTKEEKLRRIVKDPLLWIQYFCSIVDKEGRKVPFEPTYH